jgi:glutamate/tyrosine decarboxylase-like PLP-dependent enzyme
MCESHGDRPENRREDDRLVMNDELKAMQRAAARAIEFRAGDAGRSPHPPASVGELRAAFDLGLPEHGRPPEEVIGLLANAAERGLVGNTTPNFYAWVMGASHPVGVAADWLTSAWGQNAAIYQCSPAAAVAEEAAEKWLLDLLDLPRQSSVGFTTGATMAGFICLAAARSEVLRRAGWDLERDGLQGAPLIKVFVSEEAHSTVFAALRYLGIGRHNLVFIKADQEGRMRTDDLECQIAAHDGPKIVIAQAGHINSGAFDSFGPIAELVEAHNGWLHIDGAFGLWARAVPHLAALGRDLERADSWTTDGHKWLQIPYDSGFAIVKDSAAHRRAMDITASYLTHSLEDGRNPTHFGPELSRRARGFAVWAVLQALGRQGVREIVTRHCACASYIAKRLAAEPGIEILNEVVLNQLAVSFGNGCSPEEQSRLADAVADELARGRRFYLKTTEWKGRKVLRISVISHHTDEQAADNLASAIVEAWRKVGAGSMKPLKIGI